jgi:hypothetical protein
MKQIDIIGTAVQVELKVIRKKETGIGIIGYARTKENDNDRIQLLQQMIKILEKQSLVDQGYVSPISNSRKPFIERDMLIVTTKKEEDSPLELTLKKTDNITKSI